MSPLLRLDPDPNSALGVVVISVSGKMSEYADSLFTPSNCPSAAGFQNIEDRTPPAAEPANEVPWNTTDCSRGANAPAKAVPADSITAAAATPIFNAQPVEICRARNAFTMIRPRPRQFFAAGNSFIRR